MYTPYIDAVDGDIVNRTPPADVRQVLRSEVGFGCPIAGCANPYLYYHHFDPPWGEMNHHNPEGMIALCAEHHAKADAGAYTKEQLRNLKSITQKSEIRGRFDWMRNDLLAVVGGSFYYETPVIFECCGHNIIWFNRDEDRNLLLNIRMLTKSNEQRLCIEDNDWISKGFPIDLEAPPSGKLVKVVYGNGDAIKVVFFEIDSITDAKTRYPQASVDTWGISFPITAVEIHYKIGDSPFEFGPKSTTLPGMSLGNCFFSHNRVAISL